MKIIFICGCLEPGRDGVGDYTRKLSIELIKKGWIVSAIAINDKYCTTIENEGQYSQESDFPILRLPSTWKSEKRFDFAKNWIDSYNPDWISLQLVIYSYHSKGLPFNLGKSLRKLGEGFRWHLMFHETWIGISPISKSKDKIIGFIQKHIIMSIVKYVKPKVITTSNILYQLVLKRADINAIILPLFSNIDISLKNHTLISSFLSNLGLKNLRDLDSWEIIGIFGRLHPDTNLEAILQEQVSIANKKDLNLAFVAVGRIGRQGILEFRRLEKIFTPYMKFLYLGEQNEENVSTIMQLMNKGISCTPLPYIGKSGVYAAMKLHDIDTIVPEDQRFPQYDNQLRKYQSEIAHQPHSHWSVSYIAQNMINLLSIS